MNFTVQFDDEPKREIYEFCNRLLDKYDDPIMRDAMASFIVKYVVWACFERVNNEYSLADHLETMAGCVRDEIKRVSEAQPT